MNNDDIDDDQFDDFLNGKDALSRRLQALAQPSPDAALDAAILARAEQALAAQPRPAAANDAANDPAIPHQIKPLSWRWRIPAAIAATVLVGVVARQSFDSSRDLQFKQERMPETVEALIIETPTVAEQKAPPAEISVDAMRAPASVAAPPPPPAAAAPVMPAPVVELPAPTPPVNTEAAPVQLREAYSAPPAAGLARDSELAVGRLKRQDEADQKLQKSAEAPERRAALAAKPATAEGKAWLERIEALLKAGADKEALAEWNKFRSAHPDYPVADELAARLDALSR